MTDWREAARADIASISSTWATRYRWDLNVEEFDDHIDLFVTFHCGDDDAYVLRLRYLEDFQDVGRREGFCDIDNPGQCGPEYWPDGRGFTTTKGQRCICLAGTWGFHRLLHPERTDAASTQVGRLLIDIQQLLSTR